MITMLKLLLKVRLERKHPMKNKNAIIQFLDTDQSTMPHYYDYARAIHKIKQILTDKLGNEWMLCSAEDELDELFDTLQRILEHDPDKVEILASVYDTVGISTIHAAEDGSYTVTPAMMNNVFYFPDHEVAIVRIPIYQSHEDYPESFVFARDHASLLKFLSYMLDIQRQYMMDGITVFTDTEEGIMRKQEQITYQIHRDDILLKPEMKTDIFRSIDEFFLESGTFFKEYNIPYKRGILLYGSPGNGKTTLVKSIAGSVTAPVVYWQITEYTTSYSIKEVFTTVTKMAPMILVIEDIDSMPEESRSVFLNTLDGATSKEGIFIIGTTNYPEKIDPALINRAGRFDRAYEIQQPNSTLRESYLRRKDITRFLDKDKIEALTKKTDGLSIAQLNELHMSIALQWHYEQHVDVDRIIKELQANQRKTVKQAWDTDEFTRVGF